MGAAKTARDAGEKFTDLHASHWNHMRAQILCLQRKSLKSQDWRSPSGPTTPFASHWKGVLFCCFC